MKNAAKSASRYTAFFLIFVIIFCFQPVLVYSDPGWLAGWDYRVKLTIDSGDIDNPLTNFPILVYLSDSSGFNAEDITFVFDEVGANSLKIAVTENDGDTECYVEVEKWDLGNEQAWIWVKIPTISNITDTDIYLYFDNAHADNNAHVGITNSLSAENVWDANFEFVSHLRDDPDTASIRDSTTNDFDGTKIGANKPTVTTAGIIDDAQTFDGDDYISIPVNYEYSDGFTASGWMNLTDKLADYALFGRTASVSPPPNSRFQVWYDVGFSLFGIAIRDAGWQLAYGTTDPTAGLWYYVAITNDGSGTTKLFVNGVEEGAGVPNDVEAGTDGFLIGAVRSDQKLAKAIIDEVRFSNIDRSTAWLKATYETGIDDLVDFGSKEILIEPPSKLFGAGFNASSPYVSLFWKSNLTDITLFEVQNSTDKVSWDYLGQNTTAEYHDFQVVNGTERYYRVRACNFTGGVWDNSTWTDINFEKVYFIMPVGAGDCIGQSYLASSISIVVGTLNDGNLDSTFSIDGDWYNVSEENASPGLDIRVNFTDIGDSVICGCLHFYHTYTGHSQHEIQIQAYNFTSSAWVQLGNILFNETVGWACVGLGHAPEHFFSNGTLWARLLHEDQGHVAHELHIEQIELLVAYGALCPSNGAVFRPEGWVLTIMISAIGLTLVILGTRRRRR